MTESVNNSVPPTATLVEPLEIDNKSPKDERAVLMKANASLEASQIDVMGRQMQPAVEGAKNIQVPQ